MCAGSANAVCVRTVTATETADLYRGRCQGIMAYKIPAMAAAVIELKYSDKYKARVGSFHRWLLGLLLAQSKRGSVECCQLRWHICSSDSSTQ